MAVLERGFKAWSERTSLAVRKELRLHVSDALAPDRLADHLSVRLATPQGIEGMATSDLDQLLKHDPWGWSAVTVTNNSETLVIYNPNRSVGRRASDITHELAHLVLGHEPGTIVLSEDGTMAMRSFNQKQEDEANWLAWSLLLPREGLVAAVSRGDSDEQIATTFGVTETLVRFRKRLTGVERQTRAPRRPKASHATPRTDSNRSGSRST